MGEKTTWEWEKTHSKLQIKRVSNEVLLIIEKKICIWHLNVIKRFLGISIWVRKTLIYKEENEWVYSLWLIELGKFFC